MSTDTDCAPEFACKRRVKEIEYSLTSRALDQVNPETGITSETIKVGANRAAIAPSIPTAIEQGVKGFEVTAWLGLFAPAGTPDSIVESLHRSVVAVGRREDFIKRMADSGAEVVASSPGQFAEFFQREVSLYKRVAATANIRLE